MSKTYNPRNKRVLNEYGEFEPFRENVAESERMAQKAGKTRAQVLESQTLARMAYRGQDVSPDSVLKNMSEEALAAALEAKRANKNIAPVKTEPTPKTPAEPKAPTAPPAGNDGLDLSAMTVPELKAHAKDMGIPFAPNASAKKMIELLSNDGMPGGAGQSEGNDDL